LKWVAKNLGVALAYAGTAWIGLRFPYYGEYVTLIWPPVGIAIAALVLGGPRLLPGVALGSLAVNLSNDATAPGVAVSIAAGNALGPYLTATLLTRGLDFRPQLDRLRDVLAFVTVGVLGCPAITASLGTSTLYWFGFAAAENLLEAWSGWFLGDAAGVLCVGAALLVWISPPENPSGERRKASEILALATLSVVTFGFVLRYGGEIGSVADALFPSLIWASLRFGLRGATLTTLAISIATVAATIRGVGPFVGATPQLAMMSVWVFFSTTGVSALLMTALLTERDRAFDHQVHLAGELDHRVKNMLATVLALADMSRSTAKTGSDYVETFVARVRSMARTHEGLASRNWTGMMLDDVIGAVLEPFSAAGFERTKVAGQAVTVSAAAVGSLTMLLHELATNAVKYGAWSRPGGRVDVAWSQHPKDGQVELVWRESGGPEIESTPIPGYGLRLIEGIVEHELGGETRVEFWRSGVECCVRFRLPFAPTV
jgi:two-component sensor histidine kinase